MNNYKKFSKVNKCDIVSASACWPGPAKGPLGTNKKLFKKDQKSLKFVRVSAKQIKSCCQCPGPLAGPRSPRRGIGPGIKTLKTLGKYKNHKKVLKKYKKSVTVNKKYKNNDFSEL